MKELDSAAREKLDAALESVREPQSGLSLAELGLVRKFTVSEGGKAIVVHLDVGERSILCPSCSVGAGLVREGIERLLRQELARSFPGYVVHFE